MKHVIYIILCVPVLLFAQIDNSDTLNLKANLALTGFWQGGNVETLIFRAKSDLSFHASNKLVSKTTNSYVYQAFGKEKADEDILSLNFLYFEPERKFYPLLLGFISTNFRREIDLRYLLGAGVTYQVFRNNGSWLKLSLSSEYEKTAFALSNFNRPEYNTDHIINTIRSTIWMNSRYQLFEKKLIIPIKG